MACNFPRAALPPDPYPQARIFPRAQVLLDGFESVMPATAATRPQPELPQRQIRVIHHDQDMSPRHLIECSHRAYGLAARIHKGLRLAQHHPVAAFSAATQPRFKLFLESPIGS